MGFEQYHEPPEELSHKTRTFARMIASLIEEAEAIGWYEQRIALEKDSEARAIMENAQKEEFKHFGMNLEFLLRRKDDWRTELKEILFTTGDIVERGEAGEKTAFHRGHSVGNPPSPNDGVRAWFRAGTLATALCRYRPTRLSPERRVYGRETSRAPEA